MDLEVFQRLRGLKQLSTVYLVFPGAVHTRFEHSVGVAHLAGIVHERLREAGPAKLSEPNFPILNEITLTCIQLAALLHDIGHGPFGHLFEMFCRRKASTLKWDHEDFGRKLLTNHGAGDIYNQIPKVLDQIKRELKPLVVGEQATLLRLLDGENIYRIGKGRAPDLGSKKLNDRYSFLKDIVPSPFGVDRLDYLRRDAYFSGVNTGNVDVWEIVSNLRLRAFQGKYGVYLEPAVAPALEAILAARTAVFRRLYYNPVHRSAQELVVRALCQLERRPEDLVLLTDNELLDVFRQKGNEGDDFLREVYQRIKFRILYENIELVSHADITTHKATLDGHLTTGWDDYVDKKEQHIATLAKVADRRKIFYDMERVPAIRLEDFTSQIFFDPVELCPRSLFELQPHLANLFAGKLAGDLDKAQAFIDSVSKIFLSFPFEHIAGDLLAAAATPSYAIWKTKAERIYDERLKPMVEGFFIQILGVAQKAKYRANAKRIRAQSVAYLRDLISLMAQR